MARPKKVVAETGDKEPLAEGSITVTFTGDPRGGKDPEVAEYGGKSFPKGKAVAVNDPNWIKINANISKNSHFKVE